MKHIDYLRFSRARDIYISWTNGRIIGISNRFLIQSSSLHTHERFPPMVEVTCTAKARSLRSNQNILHRKGRSRQNDDESPLLNEILQSQGDGSSQSFQYDRIRYAFERQESVARWLDRRCFHVVQKHIFIQRKGSRSCKAIIRLRCWYGSRRSPPWRNVK